LGRDVIWREIGYCVCHQLASRTPEVGGHPLPVCARCAGIYLGFVLSILVQIALARGQRRSGSPPVWAAVVAGLGCGAMGIDAVSSLAGWRETTNTIRLVTGALAGSAAAVVLYALVHQVLWPRRDTRRPVGWTPLYLVILWAPAGVLPFVIGLGSPEWVGWLAVIASSAGIVAMWTAVNAVLLGVLLPWKGGVDRMLSAPTILGISFGATVVELWMAHLMHTWLYRAAGLM
jgi:uncharacterized membrane protein